MQNSFDKRQRNEDIWDGELWESGVLKDCVRCPTVEGVQEACTTVVPVPRTGRETRAFVEEMGVASAHIRRLGNFVYQQLEIVHLGH